jgi:hypothetical protein
MDFLALLVVAVLVILFWPLIKAYALLILILALLYYLFVMRPRGGRL